MLPNRLASLRRKVCQLAAEPNLSFFDLAVAIVKLHVADTPSFGDVSRLTSMSRRRLYYLLEVGRLIERSQITKAQAEAIGWTKLQIIAHHLRDDDGVSSDEVNALLGTAAITKVRGLQAALSGDSWRATRAVVFHLTDQQRGELNRALLSFGAKPGRTGLVDKEQAIMRIVASAKMPAGRSD